MLFLLIEAIKNFFVLFMNLVTRFFVENVNVTKNYNKRKIIVIMYFFIHIENDINSFKRCE